MARLYWIVIALIIAIATHAAFVLFVPSYRFAQSMAKMAGGNGSNKFFILDAADRSRLFPDLPMQSVIGVCLFDVSESDVTLKADLPDGFWLTTIYTSRGQPIYSVNNRQSGSNEFAVSLSKAPGLIEMIVQATDKERPEIDSGWTVSSTEPRGLAVVWYPLTDEAQRDTISTAMSRTRCVTGPPRQELAGS